MEWSVFYFIIKHGGVERGLYSCKTDGMWSEN